MPHVKAGHSFHVWEGPVEHAKIDERVKFGAFFPVEVASFPPDTFSQNSTQLFNR